MASYRFGWKAWAVLVAMVFSFTAQAQFNPDHSIVSSTNTYQYNYTQVPAKLMELLPPLIDGSTSGLSYQWQKSYLPLDGFTDISGATASDLVFTSALVQTTYYRRKTTDASAASTYSNIVRLETVSVNWENHNYLRVHHVLKYGSTDWKEIDGLPIGVDEKLQSTVYYDGLGRKIQKVDRQTATPATGSSTWGDMVQFSTYDQFGRQNKNYLPYTTTTQPGKYKSGTSTDQPAYYSTVYGETSAYTEVTLFDNSPLNRARKVKSPGTSWAAAAGNEMQYELNTYSEHVIKWQYTDYSTPYPAPAFNGFYGDGDLFKSVAIDENGKQTIEFVNKAGQLILKKVQLDNSPSTGHDGWICTYSIYDDFGRLRCTIEPEAVNWLEHSSSYSYSFASNPTILEDLCFFYVYDEKGRLTSKRGPGSKELKMLYDQRDRAVFTQDGNQRNKYPSTSYQEWTGVLYDELDRPVITTLYKTSKTVAALQTDINSATVQTDVTITNAGQAVTDLVVDTRDAGIATYTASNSIEFVATASTSFQSGTSDEFVAEINPSATSPSVTVVSTVYSNPIPETSLNDPSICTVLKYQFYDGYGFPAAQPFDNGYSSAYAAAGMTVPSITKSDRITGFPTGSRTRVLNTNTFLTATNYYDEDGQPVQSIEQNIKSGTDITTFQYHRDGRLLTSYNRHTTTGTGYAGFGTFTKHDFDKIGRVTAVWKKYGSNAFVKTASFALDDMGRLKEKQLSPNYGTAGLEKLAYSYNIHGQLTGINRDFALKALGYNKWQHYFGLYLGYDRTDYLGNALFANANLTGQITGAVWNTQGDDVQRKYDYEYDNAGRLSKASFNQKNGSVWENTKLDFSALGSGTSGNIEYDLNGNLLSMVQMGIVIGNASPLKVDDLQYVYFDHSNKLKKVTDAGTAGTANGKQGDFKDGSNGMADDYAYDDNGNTTKDKNKGIGNGNIKYNYLDKPEHVTIAGKGIVKYVYDADGAKLQKIFTPEGGSTSKITTYINAFTYEETKVIASTTMALLGGGGTMQSINFGEGRIRSIEAIAQSVTDAHGNVLNALLIDGTLNLPDGKKGVFDYFIKDNLSNVRMVLTEEQHTSMGTCTMETAQATNEEAVFGQVGSGNEVAATRFPVSSIPGGWTNSLIGTQVSKLQRTGHQVGPNSLLKVMAGDELSATVQYFYKNAVTNGTGTGLATNVIGSLLQSIAGQNTANGVLHGGELSNVGTQLNGTNPLVSITAPDAGNAIGNNPKAYLTILFFDERFNYVEEGSDFRRVLNANSQNELLTLLSLKAPKNGYAYVYVSNESDEPVYFDNLKLVHNRGRIAEENHYYAYGLKIAAISSRKLGDALEGKLKNERGYQGDFSDFEEELAWNDFELRTYDPQVGRWLQQDPYDEFSSPYVGMGNNPVSFVDPNGGFIDNVLQQVQCQGTKLTTLSLLTLSVNLAINSGNLIAASSANSARNSLIGGPGPGLIWALRFRKQMLYEPDENFAKFTKSAFDLDGGTDAFTDDDEGTDRLANGRPSFFKDKDGNFIKQKGDDKHILSATSAFKNPNILEEEHDPRRYYNPEVDAFIANNPALKQLGIATGSVVTIKNVRNGKTVRAVVADEGPGIGTWEKGTLEMSPEAFRRLGIPYEMSVPIDKKGNVLKNKHKLDANGKALPYKNKKYINAPENIELHVRK